MIPPPDGYVGSPDAVCIPRGRKSRTHCGWRLFRRVRIICGESGRGMSERGRERLKTIVGGAGRAAPAARPSDSVIAIRDLSLTFQTADGPVEALSHIDLDVEPGAFVSLIGPSGCGKTTLLRVIADLEQPTSGSILVNGITPDEARRTRCYGYVFQAPALYPWRTIAKNVALPLEVSG